jgi:hypothetical protein
VNPRNDRREKRKSGCAEGTLTPSPPSPLYLIASYGPPFGLFVPLGPNSRMVFAATRLFYVIVKHIHKKKYVIVKHNCAYHSATITTLVVA